MGVGIIGVRRPKDVYEAIDLLHTRVVDNIGEDSPILAVLEKTMEKLEGVDELATSKPEPETLELERLLDDPKKDAVLDPNRQCQILPISKSELEISPLKKLVEISEFPAMKELYPGLEKPSIEQAERINAYLIRKHGLPKGSKLTKWVKESPDKFVLLIHNPEFPAVPEKDMLPIYEKPGTVKKTIPKPITKLGQRKPIFEI